MEEFFGFRNFRQFERTRREIKLPYDLLNGCYPAGAGQHDGGRCRRCKRAIKLEMDRVFVEFIDFAAVEKVSKGGKTEESNLQTL